MFKKLDNFDIKKPDLIKIDVEGMEVDILTGASQIISSSNPYLIVENPSETLNRSKLLNLMNLLKYRAFGIYIVSSDGYTCTLKLNNYQINSIEKNVLCVPISRDQEFSELIKTFNSSTDLI